jgi:glutamyl-tRNA synthetase/nondiscriminating glutamyl-tRNA synthetase
MPSDAPSDAISTEVLFTPGDVCAILWGRGWLAPSDEPDAPMHAWLVRAAELLAPHAADRAALENLLTLVFVYDAAAILHEPANQAVLAREGARDVIRELANRLLAGGELARDLDSDRLKEIVDGMKTVLPYRSRDMFHPIRVALAGAAGTGELDRVILLLDAAAKLPFAAPVKDARRRMLEFCAALD